jgi:hypothetical protein
MKKVLICIVFLLEWQTAQKKKQDQKGPKWEQMTSEQVSYS